MVTQLVEKPQFEDPIDNVYDLVSQNITLIEGGPYFEVTKKLLLNQTNSNWTHVANNMIRVNPCSYMTSTASACLNDNQTSQYFDKYHVHGNRTHAFIQVYLFSENYDVVPDKKNWWRSLPILKNSRNPYLGFLTARNWIRNEVSITATYA